MSAQLVTSVALEAVMALALKYPIFPCRPMADGMDAKKPRTAHGFKDAARDEIQAYQWWDAQPDSLVGIPTGAASGLFVIDDDTAKKPDADSSAWLDKNRAMLETTRNVITASGGRHYVFRAPEGVSIKSAAGITVDGKKLHSIDVRGDGGYIIDWSAHGLGSSGDIQALPAELAAQLTQRREAPSVAPSPMSPMVWNAQRDDVARALAFLDPSGRDDWVKGGMAIHHASNGSDDGFALWHSWSAGELTGSQPASYKDEDDCRVIWNSFKNKAGTPVTLHSLFAMAIKNGYAAARSPPVVPWELSADPGSVSDSPVEDIPQALHLCTDQANAERLQKHFGNRLIVCAGSFHAWDETRWKLDDSLAQRFACELSKIVRAEADVVRAKAQAATAAVNSVEVAANLEHPRLNPLRNGDTGHAAWDLTKVFEALDTWSKKCEMKSTQDAALGMLKKLLAVDAAKLDADPWLFNCLNGTIDLRTGQLREHRAADLITKLAPVVYDATAKAPRFQQFLAEIFADDRHVVEFLSRWFGYAATGSTDEQKVVIHHGGGSNGKSTLIDTISNVLGDYASAAPDGLLAAKSSKDIHPAEIADLHGKRMVTASESEDGAKLREAFVKQASGGDKLKGRRLYGQLFEFTPTHKLQLLTNKKPEIHGTDFAIWRRILLVPYYVTFGTPEQVEARQAQRVGDPALKSSLPVEYPGILAWIVEGARQWNAAKSLRPPDAVLAASREYRRQENRIGLFVQECARLERQAWTSSAGLYGQYAAWCRESGIEPVSQKKFLDDLEEHVPDFRREKQRGTRGVFGITLTTGIEPYVPPVPVAVAG
jgi:P4 family phage/plasmid primase-like protien